MDLSLEGAGVLECWLAPAKAVLRNMITNGGKTLRPSTSLCLGAGMFICIDAVWEIGFCSQFFVFYKK